MEIRAEHGVPLSRTRAASLSEETMSADPHAVESDS
jgi:hypothetical protein